MKQLKSKFINDNGDKIVSWILLTMLLAFMSSMLFVEESTHIKRQNIVSKLNIVELSDKISIVSIIITTILTLSGLILTSVLFFKYQNKKDNHDLATSALLVSPIQYDGDAKSAKVTKFIIEKNKIKQNGEVKTHLVYPMKLKVMSGSIVEMSPISSFFQENEVPVINVGSATNTQKECLKEMTNVDIKLYIEDIATFYDDYFYQSYLLKGADKSKILIMLWFDISKPRQGVLTRELSLSTYNNNIPEEIMYQYRHLYSYLKSNEINLL